MKKMKKKRWILFTVVLLLICLMGCSSPKNTTETAEPETPIQVTETPSQDSETLSEDLVEEPSLSEAELQVEQIQTKLKKFLEDVEITGADEIVYPTDDEMIWIQVFARPDSDLAAKLDVYEQAVIENSALSEQQKEEWDSWVEACRVFCVDITQNISSQNTFQLGTENAFILLQINSGEVVVDRLSK